MLLYTVLYGLDALVMNDFIRWQVQLILGSTARVSTNFPSTSQPFVTETVKYLALTHQYVVEALLRHRYRQGFAIVWDNTHPNFNTKPNLDYISNANSLPNQIS